MRFRVRGTLLHVIVNCSAAMSTCDFESPIESTTRSVTRGLLTWAYLIEYLAVVYLVRPSRGSVGWPTKDYKAQSVKDGHKAFKAQYTGVRVKN